MPDRPFSERYPHLWGDALRGIGIVAFGLLFLGSPDVMFRSSDGRWADSEVQSKGRSFDGIAYVFEDYKVRCHAPNAVLVRATPQIWWNVFAWPSYATAPKWRVPYSNAQPENDHPPSAQLDCANAGLSPVESRSADLNAKVYLDSLKTR